MGDKVSHSAIKIEYRTQFWLFGLLRHRKIAATRNTASMVKMKGNGRLKIIGTERGSCDRPIRM